MLLGLHFPFKHQILLTLLGRHSFLPFRHKMEFSSHLTSLFLFTLQRTLEVEASSLLKELDLLIEHSMICLFKFSQTLVF